VKPPNQRTWSEIIHLVELKIEGESTVLDWLIFQKQLAATSAAEIAALKARVAKLETEGPRGLVN